jgi:hypothetical protein
VSAVFNCCRLYIGAYGSFDGRRLCFNMTSGPGDSGADNDDPVGSYRFEFRQDTDGSRRPKHLIRVSDVLQWDGRHEEEEIKAAIDQAGLKDDLAARASRNLRNLRRVFTQGDIVPLSTIDENIVNARQARSIDEILDILGPSPQRSQTRHRISDNILNDRQISEFYSPQNRGVLGTDF